jgi:valyl-tRNA synthetase
MNAEGYEPQARPATVYDRWILSRFHHCVEQTRESFEKFELSDAANGIYRFIWNELCDWAIELSKPALYGEKSPRERAGAQTALLTALEGALRLLHPFMPFVTEEVWQRLPNRSGRTIMLAPFPTAGARDEEAEREMDIISRAIDGARSVRGEVNLPPNQRVPLTLFARDPALFERHQRAFQHLANATEVTLNTFDAPRPRQAAVHVEPEVEVHLPLAGLIDFAAERARVEKEIARTESELQGLRKRLDNAGFVERAPVEVVEKGRARAEELAGKREKLARHLARVTGVEATMEDKKPQQSQGDGASTEQGNRGLDQLGTHGGPASGMSGQPSRPPQSQSRPPPPSRPPAQSRPPSTPPQSRPPSTPPQSRPPSTPPQSRPPSTPPQQSGAGEEAGAGEEVLGTAGAPVQASDEDEQEGLAARAISRVKSIARGIMEKVPGSDERRGPVSQEEENEERAEIAQARASSGAAPRSRPKTHKAKPAAKSVRGGGNKADKAGKVGAGRKAGRVAAARGAKKGTRGAGGKLKKQGKRPMKTQSRANVRWSASGPSGGRGQGRGAQKGARGKSGGKRRPSPRKGTK